MNNQTNNQIHPQGLANIYWKSFENSGHIDDFLRYAKEKEHQNAIYHNNGFNNPLLQTGGFQ